jgi:RNA polymerase sigma factor (sigma-70 family)
MSQILCHISPLSGYLNGDMIKASLSTRDGTTDCELVGRTLDGDTDAFEHIVSRYQSLICSLTYSATGSLGQSQDLAQETFITAWKHLRLLREREKLRAWLCGIARRIIGTALRRDGREPVHAAEPLETIEESATVEPLPSEHVISREEEAILWRSLERIPEIYREPLVLFYREHQSMEAVAASLDLNEEAVRQRLSRGRRLLQEEVLSFVEGALERSTPGKAFTIGVLAALPVVAASSATAASVGATVAAKAGATAKASTGLLALNAFAGPLMGFVSGYIGYRMSMEGAASEKERSFIKRFYVLMTIFIVAPLLILLLAVWGKSLAVTHPRLFSGVLMGAANSWIPATGLMVLWMRRSLRELNGPAAGNAARRSRTTFEYRSKASFLGLPLIHIRLGATWASQGDAVKAWVAIADDLAIGGLFAFGGTALAPICFGGFALGGIVFAGFGAGILCYAGFGIGAWVVGGMVSGFMAVGGCAFGWKAALGGIAIAQEFASGGVALAAHANDAASNSFVKGDLFFQNAFLLVTKWLWPTLLISMIPTLLIWRTARRQRQAASLGLLITGLAAATFVQAAQSTALGQTTDSGKARAFSVEVVGHGDPMILIPGLTCGGDVWKTTVEHFKDRYECHVLTLAGFAGQAAIPAPMLETIRNEIAAYVREKKLNHPVILGHSLGGFLSFWIGAAEPDLVGPLISVDGGTFFCALMDPNSTVESAKASAEGMRQFMEAQTVQQFAANNKMYLSSMIKDPKNVDSIAPTCAKSDPKAVALAMYELMTTDLRNDVARIKSPVLLIGNGALATTPEMKKSAQARYEAQVAKIPKHKVVIAEKAGHFIMLDDPAFLFSAMDDFLRSAKVK